MDRAVLRLRAAALLVHVPAQPSENDFISDRSGFVKGKGVSGFRNLIDVKGGSFGVIACFTLQALCVYFVAEKDVVCTENSEHWDSYFGFAELPGEELRNSRFGKGESRFYRLICSNDGRK